MQIIIVALIAPLPFTGTMASGFRRGAGCGEFQQAEPQETLPQTPSHNLAQRIKLIAKIRHEMAFGEPIASVVVIDPGIATVEIKGDRSLVITGLRAGATFLIISGKSSRVTYAIDVERAPVPKQPKSENELVAPLGSFSGSNSLYFTPSSNGVPSLLREAFDYRQKLANNRMLRMSGDLFRFFGGGERAFAQGPTAKFGANRINLGLDSPTIKLDLLDSALDISQFGFSGYVLRGPHLVSTRDSRWRGLELFAGNASPQLTLFNQGQGRVAGAIIPLIQSKSFRIRTGFYFIAPSRALATPANAAGPRGGMVLHTDARYVPDERTTFEGEAAYANGGVSWRGKLDLRRGAFDLLGELSNLDRRSPMTAIGAQPGAHKTSTFSLRWQPAARFSASAGYYRTTTVPLQSASRFQLNSTSLVAGMNYRPTAATSLGFSINQQAIDAPASTLGTFLFNLQTRTAVIKYDQRLNNRWANDVEVRVIQSAESKTNAQVSQGLTLREQLRFRWPRGFVTGFINYRSNTPSLESLIIRNPGLLPLELRAAFAADPVRFLLTNRDALPLLLSGIELPLTQNKEGGVRFQSAFTRLNISGEVAYSAGKFIATEQRTLLTSFSADLRLDGANSVLLNVARGFAFSGTGTHTSITVGYVHRFGAGSGGSFQFASLLGLDRGNIRGRVFADLNGNGQEDPGESGIAGMTVRINDKQSVLTDSRGDFAFGSLVPGDFDIELISEDLGVRLRASNATNQHISLLARHTVKLQFGLTSSGFVAGRVFNDLALKGEQSAGNAPGVAGVKLILRLAEITDSEPVIQTADGNGMYEFSNLSPGKYLLEIDAATVPANFRLPAQMQWPLTVGPLQGVYLDLPVAAQRAVTGVVYMDFDGDGKFSSGNDTPIPGASVRIGEAEAITDETGSFILRNMVSGKVEIRAETNRGYASPPLTLELPSSPGIIRGISLALFPVPAVSPGVPLEAQGVVSGTVYMDFDGDGRFSPGIDTPIPGACVKIGNAGAITDKTGSYMLRNISAGQAEIRATTSRGYASGSITIDIPASSLRDVNLAITRTEQNNSRDAQY